MTTIFELPQFSSQDVKIHTDQGTRALEEMTTPAPAPKASPATRSFPYSVSLADGTQESRQVDILTSEGVIISDLENAVIDIPKLMESLDYIQSNPPIFAVGDSAVKVPGWRVRAPGEPLSLAEETIGLDDSSPNGLVLTSTV